MMDWWTDMGRAETSIYTHVFCHRDIVGEIGGRGSRFAGSVRRRHRGSSFLFLFCAADEVGEMSVEVRQDSGRVCWEVGRR